MTEERKDWLHAEAVRLLCERTKLQREIRDIERHIEKIDAELKQDLDRDTQALISQAMA